MSSISTCIFYHICSKFAGRLLDRVNTPLDSLKCRAATAVAPSEQATKLNNPGLCIIRSTKN